MDGTVVPILKNKLPDFVQDNYPRFVKYITDYLTWLEHDDNFLGIINSWRSNLEPENNVEPYLDAILSDLGFSAGQNLAVDKKLLIFMLKDFYLSRGSVGSFKFLFRILFNQDVDIRYPREEMLIPSYANYGERHFIYTSSDNVNSVDFEALVNHIKDYGGTLTGLSSKLNASIENIQIVHGSGKAYLRIEILRPSREFTPNEAASITAGDFQFAEFIKPSLNINIVNPGIGYSVGDQIFVSDVSFQGHAEVSSIKKGSITGLQIVNGGTGHSVGEIILAISNTGSGFSGIVTSVGSGGAITGVKVLNGGYNYETIPNLSISGIRALSNNIGGITSISITEPFIDYTGSSSITVSSTGSGAVLTASPKTRFTFKEWSNEKGFLGINSTIIDSDKVQQFAYKIISPVGEELYKSFIDEYLHPTGYIYSSSFSISSNTVLNISVEGGTPVEI